MGGLAASPHSVTFGGWRLQHCGSQDRLNVGKYDLLHSIDLGKLKDRLHPFASISLPIHAKCFNGHIEPNLVAVLEAIRDRFLGGEYADTDTVEL